ncbi:hypothetical protein K438DRAFT_1943620 [Mycena galopus ATCC 62051]|nr:hypothetical protein K438DRAFT_1943620 [Mycena galopus ATCC 62051]
MPRVSRTRRSTQRRVPYLHQVTIGLVKIFGRVPISKTIEFSDVLSQAQDNAEVYDSNIIGPRFKPLSIGHLRSLVHLQHDRGLIEADFKLKTLQITRKGDEKFRDIEVEVGDKYIDDEPCVEMDGFFLASKENIGPRKNLTKAALGILLDEQYLRVKEQDHTIKDQRNTIESLEDRVRDNRASEIRTLAAEVVRCIDILNEADPCTSGTPIRKTLSMGAYPTPDSLPRRRGAVPQPQSPPPSPSPRGSFTIPMDVDDEDEVEVLQQLTIRDHTDAAVQHVPNSVEIETESELATVKAELRQAQADLQAAREERDQALVAAADVPELQERIGKLEEQVRVLEEEKVTAENSRKRWLADTESLRGLIANGF